MCSCLRKGLLLPTSNESMSQTAICPSVEQNLKHTQQTKVIRVIIQEEVNTELFYMFVEISNSKVINRPNAEDQPLVEEYGCMNHNACIFRKR